jgi:anaphase-promoting complex subunit 1
MASSAGESALGTAGYLPTSLGKPLEARVKGLSDLIMGLHLLLEEQKLDIMTPEYTSSGRADLRAILCQMTRWLKWQDFLKVYEVGLHEELDHRNDSGMVPSRKIRTYIANYGQNLCSSQPSHSRQGTRLIYLTGFRCD